MYSFEYTGLPFVDCMLLNCSILLVKKDPPAERLFPLTGLENL
nr:MAG TPA: hypothetical protein [Caudoviricetes sp.]